MICNIHNPKKKPKANNQQKICKIHNPKKKTKANKQQMICNIHNPKKKPKANNQQMICNIHNPKKKPKANNQQMICNIHNPKKKPKANNQQMICNRLLPSIFIWINILKTDWIFWVSLLLLSLSLKKNLYIKIKDVNPSIKSTRQMRAQVDTTKRKNESKHSTEKKKKGVRNPCNFHSLAIINLVAAEAARRER
jgi:hypothetical protein